MRRNFDLIRDILLAIGDENLCEIGDRSIESSSLSKWEWERVDYHLNLLETVRLITGTQKVKKKDDPWDLSRHFRSDEEDIRSDEEDQCYWHSLDLTWEGHDFIDAIGDEKLWKKVQKGVKFGSKTAVTEAFKQIGKMASSTLIPSLLQYISSMEGDVEIGDPLSDVQQSITDTKTTAGSENL